MGEGASAVLFPGMPPITHHPLAIDQHIAHSIGLFLREGRPGGERSIQHLKTLLAIQRKSIMSNTIVPFQFDGYQIRVVLNGGEPWFVAKDVCEVLEQPSISKVVSRLKEYEKGMHIMHTLFKGCKQ